MPSLVQSDADLPALRGLVGIKGKKGEEKLSEKN